MPDHRHVPPIIAAIAARSEAQTRELARAWAGGCWPRGSADRTDPIAREWVRQWSPRPAPMPLPACECRDGRCRVCN